MQSNIRETAHRRASSFRLANSRGKLGDYLGDHDNHDPPDRTRLTGTTLCKPGSKDIGIPRFFIFILIISPNKISDTTNESKYIHARTGRDIVTMRAHYSEPKT